MVIDFISTWHIYLLTTCITISISLLCKFFFSKLSISFETTKHSLEKARLISASITALYGLLVGFVIFSLWNNFQQIQKLVSKEASAIAFVTHIRNSYPKARDSKELTTALNSYINFLPNDVLPQISDKKHSLELQSAYNLLIALSHITSKTNEEKTLLLRLESKLIKGIDSKRDRLALSSELPIPILIILFGGGIIILFVVSASHSTKNSSYFTLGNIGIAALIGFYLALALDLDTPYSGNIGYLHLNSSPYIEEIIKQLSY